MDTTTRQQEARRGDAGLGMRLRDDRGSVMLIAIACLTILFILTTMLLMFASSQTSLASRDEKSQKRLHLADAGLNAYLFELKRDPNYWSLNPTMGPHVTADGTWTVSAAKSGEYLVVRSSATAVGAQGTRTVVSKVTFPTFADYTMLSDGPVRIGADAVIYGKIHSNSALTGGSSGYAVEHAGKLYAVEGVPGSGQIYAVGRILTVGSAWYVEGGTAGLHSNQDVVDFTQVTQDLDDIRVRAVASNTRFTIPTSGIGYRLTLAGGGYTLHRVAGNKYTGGLTYTLVQSGTIPSTGVFYFDGDVWVQGNYGVMVTVASAGDILICQNITATTPSLKKTCGLIAAKNVWIPDSYSLTEMPTDLTIQAALVAMTGKCGAYLSGVNPRLRTRATFLGSRAYKLPSGAVAVDGSGRELYGFSNRTYTYDANLDSNPPPMFPVIHAGSLKVVTWTER